MDTVELVLPYPLRRADVPILRGQLVRLLPPAGTVTVISDVSRFTQPDTVTLEALASLSLAAKEHHCRFALRGIPAGLAVLLDMTGLSQALPSVSRIEAGRHMAHREDHFGVQEHVEAGDAPIDDVEHL